MTEDGFYIPQMQVGAEFKSMDISAPLQILQLTAGEKIGVEPKTEKEIAFRKIEKELEQQSNPNKKLTPADKRITPPLHASLRCDFQHEFVKEAKLTCVDDRKRIVKFDCAFTPALRLGEGAQSWNALVRGCVVWGSEIERFNIEELHQMIHYEKLNPDNLPLLVTADPKKYNVPTDG